MRLSRPTFALLGGVTLLLAPAAIVLVSSLSALMFGQADPFDEFGRIMLQGADEVAPKAGSSRLIGGIFLVLLFGGSLLYLLLCILGVILLMILRELLDLRRIGLT